MMPDGYLTSTPGVTLAYDLNNRLLTYNDTGRSLRPDFCYRADGLRAWKTTNGGPRRTGRNPALVCANVAI